MAYKKTFVISDESVNDNGFWVRTAGIDLSNAQKNCPAYFMHQTWDIPLGHWENFAVNDKGQLLADIVIDGANDIEKEYIRKIENGDIKGASIGADIIEWSSDPLLIKDGQTVSCLFKSSLFEVSLAPLNSNKNALALKKDGNIINLSSEESNKQLPVLKSTYTMKTIALKLGLAETAGENDILSAIGTLQLNAKHTQTIHDLLVKQNTVGLSDEQKNVFVTLAKTDFPTAITYADSLKQIKPEETITATGTTVIKKDVTLSALIQNGKQAATTVAADGDKDCYDYLQKHNAVELARLHKEDPEKYAQLAKDYGAGKRYTGK